MKEYSDIEFRQVVDIAIEREKLRQKGKFDEADELRQRIVDIGWEINDDSLDMFTILKDGRKMITM